MKYHAAQLLALVSWASAILHSQLPAFGMLSFSLPTGAGTGTSTDLRSGLAFPTNIPSFVSGTGFGSEFSLPTNIPGFGSGGTGGSSWTDWLSDLGGGFGSGGDFRDGAATSAAAPVVSATATATGSAAAPTWTTPTGIGTVEANYSPQKAASSSENGVKGKNCCTDMTVIFARGTGELENMATVTAPPMVKSIRSKLGASRVTVQGVTYAASAAGNANLGGDSGQTMADLVHAAKSQCPDSKFIVSGYSQGAMVVHNAFSKGVSASDVAGAVMFGGPLKRQAIIGLSLDKVKEFCVTSDQICGGGGDGRATGSHLIYGSSADAAAVFAI